VEKGEEKGERPSAERNWSDDWEARAVLDAFTPRSNHETHFTVSLDSSPARNAPAWQTADERVSAAVVVKDAQFKALRFLFLCAG
jgi:hypothetical protein